MKENCSPGRVFAVKQGCQGKVQLLVSVVECLGLRVCEAEKPKLAFKANEASTIEFFVKHLNVEMLSHSDLVCKVYLAKHLTHHPQVTYTQEQFSVSIHFSSLFAILNKQHRHAKTVA